MGRCPAPTASPWTQLLHHPLHAYDLVGSPSGSMGFPRFHEFARAAILCTEQDGSVPHGDEFHISTDGSHSEAQGSEPLAGWAISVIKLRDSGLVFLGANCHPLAASGAFVEQDGIFDPSWLRSPASSGH